MAASFEMLQLACDGIPYLARLDCIGEVLMPAALRAIPGAPPLLLGLLNLRGDMLPVIDLAPRLGTRHGPDVGRVWRSRNRILRIEHRDRQLGVAVDLVGGIHQLQPDQRRKPVLGDGVADLCLGDLWLMDGVTVQEIRFDALLDGLEQGLLSPQDHRTLP